MGENREQHIGAITPNPAIHELIEMGSTDGRTFRIPEIPRPLDGEEAVIVRLHEYDQKGRFVDDHEVKLPRSRISEAREVVLEFTERHRKAFEISAAAITFTLAVHGLVYKRRHHK